MHPSKTVLFFGDYDVNYPRTWTLRHAFEKLGFTLIDLNIQGRTGFKKYKMILKEWRQVRRKFDLVVVPFPGETIFPLIRMLTRKPILYDALISVYDTDVHDRRYFKPWSVWGIYCYFLDWMPSHWAEVLLTDTKVYGAYFIKTFHADPNKVRRLWTGANREKMKPLPPRKPNGVFRLGFQGKVVDRITGLETIVDAMEILKDHEDIQLRIIGPEDRMGLIKAYIQKKGLKNIEFTGWLTGEPFLHAIEECDLLLGSFGNTEKLKRAIPLKVWDALAMKRPILVGDTLGARELLVEGEHAVFARLASAQDIAEKILQLKNNSVWREKIIEAGYNRFAHELSLDHISNELGKILHSIKA